MRRGEHCSPKRRDFTIPQDAEVDLSVSSEMSLRDGCLCKTLAEDEQARD